MKTESAAVVPHLSWQDTHKGAYPQRKTESVRSESEKNPDKSIEEELRLEVLKLRIENERLKKKYTVKKTEDGKTEYVRLKMKNTR